MEYFVDFLNTIRKQNKDKAIRLVLVFPGQIIYGTLVDVASGFETLKLTDVHRNNELMSPDATFTFLCSSVIGWTYAVL